MFILGRTNDDVGAQLESLTKLLLAHLSYSKLLLNSIDPGGSEIDVLGQFVLPGVPESRAELVCECKARQDPLTTTDWLKFLGKVFQHGQVHGKTTFGCLIALNGCNGSVHGAYNTLLTRYDRIKVADAADVRKLISENGLLCEQDSAEATSRSLTSRPIVEMKPAYYSGTFYWVCGFDENVALILDQNGVPLDKTSRDRVMPLVAEVSRYVQHINLDEEQLAQRRMSHATKAALGRLFAGSVSSLESLRKELPEFEAELQPAISKLTDLKWAVCESNCIRLNRRGNWQQRFSEVIQFVMTSEVPVKAMYDILGSRIYKESINEKLWAYAIKVQGNLPVPVSMTEQAVTMMWLSPACLAYFTTPNEMILKHKSEGFLSEKRLAALDVDYLFDEGAQRLQRDFAQPYLMAFYYKDCGIVELETKFQLIFKSFQGIAVKIDGSNRRFIGIASEEYGGGFVPIRPLPDMKEPWEANMHPMAKEVVDLAYEKAATGRIRYGPPTN